MQQAPLSIPDFLTQERERAIFRLVVDDYLQRRVARAPDMTAFGRWAAYVHRWMIAKETLESSGSTVISQATSTGSTKLVRNPVFADMLDLERLLQGLEDRLGLNPLARQNIMRGLAAMPAAMGKLFSEEQPPAEAKPAKAPTADVMPQSPLGFLMTAGKPN